MQLHIRGQLKTKAIVKCVICKVSSVVETGEKQRPLLSVRLILRSKGEEKLLIEKAILALSTRKRKKKNLCEAKIVVETCVGQNKRQRGL